MSQLDPDLQRLGDALNARAAANLSRDQQATHADQLQPRRAHRPASRLLAGGTLGLAGVGAGLVLALGIGGATSPPAFAITKHDDGSLTVNLDNDGGLIGANRKLAAMGYDEHIQFRMAQGPASVSGPVECVASPNGATVSGPPVSVTVGPNDSNTETIASGNTGAGVWHVANCQRLSGTATRADVVVSRALVTKGHRYLRTVNVRLTRPLGG